MVHRATTEDCWNTFYNSHVCCKCGFPSCFATEIEARLCCPGTPSVWVNSSMQQARNLICQAEEVQAQCFQMPGALRGDCLEMLRHYHSLAWECRELLASIDHCAVGSLVAEFTLARYPIFSPTSTQDTQECLKWLGRLRLIFNRLKANRISTTQIREHWLETRYLRMMKRCGQQRKAELLRHLPRASAAFASKELRTKRPWVSKRPRIGVIMALSQKSLGFYGAVLDMWRCYCRHHGDCELVVELDDFLRTEDYPSLTMGGPDWQTKYGKSWNRWYALRRHLDSFEWVLSADPDQFFSRSCFGNVSLSSLLPGPGEFLPITVFRDFPTIHALNSAGVFFRGGEAARLFLDLMFEKVHYPGHLDFDQSIWDVTILEFIDLWSAVSTGASTWRSTWCLVLQVPFLTWEFSLQEFNECWHEVVSASLGEYGSRQAVHHPVRLVPPETVDINFVVGPRDIDDAPLIWHLAGQAKFSRPFGGSQHMHSFLANDWGLNSSFVGEAFPPEASSLQCQVWEDAWSAVASTCHPGTTFVDCRQGYLAMC